MQSQVPAQVTTDFAGVVRQEINGKRHESTFAIKVKSWFGGSNSNYREILVMYYLSSGLPQQYFVYELDLVNKNVEDWLNFAREVCEDSLRKLWKLSAKDKRVDEFIVFSIRLKMCMPQRHGFPYQNQIRSLQKKYHV